MVTMVCLALLVLAASVLRLCVGREFGWPGGDLVTALWRVITAGVWDENGSGASIFLEIRLYRVILAVLVGVALATSGVALQSLLRNPLAEPFILGLSSGAGVGVMTEMLVAYYLNLPSGTHHTGALIGALVSMLIVYGAGQRHGAIDPLGLLLAGVVLSTINGAIIVMSALKADDRVNSGDMNRACEVVVDATRHIVSTTLTTIGGFLPLIIAGGTFWPPLATAIAGGVAGSAIIALYTVPSIYLLIARRPQTEELEEVEPLIAVGREPEVIARLVS